MTARGLRSMLLTAFLASVAVQGARAQTIEGVLLERGSDRPIELALVSMLTMDGDSVQSVLTDREGRFRVQTDEPGEYRLAASSLGYRPTIAGSIFTLERGGSISIQFRVEPTPVELSGVTVEARASLLSQPKLVSNGFVDRFQNGLGTFIAPFEIERSSALSTADLLTRTGRVTTRYSLGGERIAMLGTGGYCTPIIYLDGARVNLDGLSIDVVAPLQTIEAVEVYRTASQAPLQYGGTMGGCGVLLIWTKAR